MINFIKENLDLKFQNHVFIVGGFVRDKIIGNIPHDIDLVVDVEGYSKELCFDLYNKFPDKISYPFQLGHYPIWSIVFNDDINGFSLKGQSFEVAETMEEEFDDINSRQRNVRFSSLRNDVLRRDFTINSLLINVYTNDIVDFVGGVKDIYNKIIKVNDFVDPEVIFSQDPLRILRMVVFKIRYGFQIEERTFNAAKKVSHRLSIVSKERISSEINKLGFINKSFYEMVLLFDELNILEMIFPKIYRLKNIKQQPDIRKIHLESDNVFGHTLEVLKNIEPTLLLQYAALFHDVGKQLTREFVDGKTSFKNHENAGLPLVKESLSELRYDNKFIDDVCFLVKNHMKPNRVAHESNKSKRKFLRECDGYVDELIKLALADAHGTFCEHEIVYDIEPMIKSVNVDNNIVVKKKPILNGNEIMEILGIGPSKLIKTIQEFILDLEDEFPNISKDDVIREIVAHFK